MATDPYALIQAFEAVSDHELNRPLLYVKKIGVAASGIGFVSFGLFTIIFDQNTFTDNVFALALKDIGLIGIGLGIFLFSVLAAYAVGRNGGKTTFLSAIAYTLKKVFIYIYLPSFVVLAITVLILYFR